MVTVFLLLLVVADGKVEVVVAEPGRVVAEVVLVVKVLVLVVVQTVIDIDPGEPSNMESCRAFELTQAAPQSDWLKDVAPSNMRLI